MSRYSTVAHLVPVIPGIVRNFLAELLPIWYRELPALWGILYLSSCPFGTGYYRDYEEFIKTPKTYITSSVIDPQEYVLQGFPLHLLSTKTPKTYNELCFDGWKLKRELCLKNVKINPQEYVLQGFPFLYYLQKLQKHRTNSLLMG